MVVLVEMVTMLSGTEPRERSTGRPVSARSRTASTIDLDWTQNSIEVVRLVWETTFCTSWAVRPGSEQPRLVNFRTGPRRLGGGHRMDPIRPVGRQEPHADHEDLGPGHPQHPTWRVPRMRCDLDPNLRPNRSLITLPWLTPVSPAATGTADGEIVSSSASRLSSLCSGLRPDLVP